MRERESAQLTFADSVVAHLGGRRTRTTLDQLDQSIDWEALATPVRRLYRNDHGGNPAGPVVMMLKILLLQKWFNLSDPQAQEQINDRLSFRRFVGLRAQDSAPDETTIVKFRDRLRRGGVEACRTGANARWRDESHRTCRRRPRHRGSNGPESRPSTVRSGVGQMFLS
jgi:IS5 family transposase